MEFWERWIPIFLQALMTGVTAFILWRKAMPEIEKTRAEAISEDADAVESYANAARVVQEQYDRVSKEVKDLRAEIYKRDKIIIEQKAVIDDLKDWSERLIYQLKSVNKDIEPVPFKPGSNDIINV